MTSSRFRDTIAILHQIPPKNTIKTKNKLNFKAIAQASTDNKCTNDAKLLYHSTTNVRQFSSFFLPSTMEKSHGARWTMSKPQKNNLSFPILKIEKFTRCNTYLTPTHDVSSAAEHVNDFSFSLIAPLRAKNDCDFAVVI